MPSDAAYWLVSAPLKNGDDNDLFRSIKTVVTDNTLIGGLELPSLKAGTLSSLLTLSDALPKHDAYFTSVVAKLLDTIKSLAAAASQSASQSQSQSQSDQDKLESYARINDLPPTQYLIPHSGARQGWTWDAARWGQDGKVIDVVEALVKEMNSIDSIQKQKVQGYNLAKGSLAGMQRKKMGNLSTKSLVGIVSKEDVVVDSEYLETLLVAVPNNLVRDWKEKYERLTTMVVPRSSSEITKDDEYTLFNVTVFKKVKDEYLHKCREHKFLAREFAFDDEAEQRQQQEMEEASAEEKELWTDLLRLSRTNFSEAYQLLVHLKVVRLYVESVLRYGLPADYSAIVLQPDSKTSLKTLKSLSSYFQFLASKERGTGKKASGTGGNNDEVAGEWGAVMEQEYYDFVLFEVPKVVT
ncbi:hypothetical protein FFLO_05822 [Filobasidium floriforme]|uniref:V-type proton ATPase subunit C n=1 Tax=Filobasidium floriforme TaxID=5210 RepID=A0A8K0JHI3_9TREE|nr:hypothetical protein FFLO_05822 [Filobasidium floriforme]